MIISVDTGNKHMKTENCEFNSGVEILDTLPGDMEEVIEYEGKYYVTTNRRISYMEDKIADERYFILTLFAIAKELSYREKNEGLLSGRTAACALWETAEKIQGVFLSEW